MADFHSVLAARTRKKVWVLFLRSANRISKGVDRHSGFRPATPGWSESRDGAPSGPPESGSVPSGSMETSGRAGFLDWFCAGADPSLSAWFGGYRGGPKVS